MGLCLRFASDEWEKTETEGTLFVYERNCDPQFGFLILNRRSTRNLVEPVTKELDFQLQTPFLLYKTKVRRNLSVNGFDEQKSFSSLKF